MISKKKDYENMRGVFKTLSRLFEVVYKYKFIGKWYIDIIKEWYKNNKERIEKAERRGGCSIFFKKLIEYNFFEVNNESTEHLFQFLEENFPQFYKSIDKEQYYPSIISLIQDHIGILGFLVRSYKTNKNILKRVKIYETNQLECNWGIYRGKVTYYFDPFNFRIEFEDKRDYNLWDYIPEGYWFETKGENKIRLKKETEDGREIVHYITREVKRTTKPDYRSGYRRGYPPSGDYTLKAIYRIESFEVSEGMEEHYRSDSITQILGGSHKEETEYPNDQKALEDLGIEVEEHIISEEAYPSKKWVANMPFKNDLNESCNTLAFKVPKSLFKNQKRYFRNDHINDIRVIIKEFNETDSFIHYTDDSHHISDREYEGRLGISLYHFGELISFISTDLNLSRLERRGMSNIPHYHRWGDREKTKDNAYYISSKKRVELSEVKNKRIFHALNKSLKSSGYTYQDDAFHNFYWVQFKLLSNGEKISYYLLSDESKESFYSEKLKEKVKLNLIIIEVTP
jgi:hypothetical protein